MSLSRLIILCGMCALFTLISITLVLFKCKRWFANCLFTRSAIANDNNIEGQLLVDGRGQMLAAGMPGRSVNNESTPLRPKSQPIDIPRRPRQGDYEFLKPN